METKKYNSHSLTFINHENDAELSICTTSGEHLLIKLTPSQCALVNGKMTIFVADQFRALAHPPPGSKPKEVPFSDDVRPDSR